MVDNNLKINSFLLLFTLWLLQAVYQVLCWTYWLQVKEYRLDRFWVFLKTSDGRRRLGLIIIFLKFLFLAFFNEFPLFFFSLIFYIDTLFLKDLVERRIKKPVVTERIKKIWLTSLFGFVIVFLTRNFLWGEVLSILTPFLGIFLTIPIVNRVKKEEIRKALKVLNRVKPIVIGITGSYGKTTTKEFVAHLLSQKFKTAKTEGSENTEFGIARKTYKNVVKGTKFFVVEMGAYRKGEIAKLAKIVNPQVGIITGIEEQHLSLFGSLENIKNTKFELIEALPENGVAIFNLSNKDSQELAQKARLIKGLKVFGYYVGSKANDRVSADIFSKVVSATPEKINFKVFYNNEMRKLTANLTGIHFLENLTAAILVARHFGVPWKNIKKGCKSIKIPENRMEVYKLKTGSVVINDTYNSTPRAFESALKYLSLFKRKKRIVVTSGVIELGNVSDIFHRKIGEELAKFSDYVFLTNKDFYKSISLGMGRKKSKLILGEEAEIREKLIKLVKTNKNVFLLEGRIPASILEIFKKN